MQLPDWKPFTSGDPPPAADVIEPGRVVALVAPSQSTGESWAPALAFAIASGWADHGHKVVIADAALESPSLHEEAGLVNGEGLVDAACFGASVARVAQAVPRQPFYLVTAGSPAADASAVARSPRMARLVAGFGEAGVTLLLFVREDGSGAEDFLAFAEDVVVLAPSPAEGPRLPDAARASVRAVIGPRTAPEPVGVRSDLGDVAAGALAEDVGASEADRVEGGSEEPMSFTPPEVREEGEPAAAPPKVGEEEQPVAAPPEGAPAAVEPTGTIPGAHARERSRGAGSRSADPNARRKLLLVALVVLLIALLVVLGALRG